MGMDFIQKLPTPAEIREQYPVPPALAALKKQRDKEIADVLTGQSDKLLVIIGPCSADNEDAVCDYVERLAKVNERLMTDYLSFRVFIQISRVQPVKATRASSISRILPKSRIFCRVS